MNTNKFLLLIIIVILVILLESCVSLNKGLQPENYRRNHATKVFMEKEKKQNVVL